MWKKIIIGLTFFLFAGIFSANAGWVIIQQSHDSFGNKSFGTTFIQDSLIRIDKPTSINIINLNKKTITLIFAQQRSYWKGTAQELNKTTTQMAEEQMTKLMALAPEPQRQQIKQALDSLKKNRGKPDSLKSFPQVIVKNTGHSDTIIGYPAVKYEIIIDSTLKQYIWVTRKVKPYQKANIKRLMAFSRAMSPYAIENSLSHSKKYMQLLMEGFILKSVNYTTDGNKLVTRITRIKQMKIPEAMFQIPPGYFPTTLENVMNLDIKNNILNPDNLSPKNNGLPPLPQNNNINPK